MTEVPAGSGSPRWKEARRAAFLQDALATLTQNSDDLLSFEQVSRKLRLADAHYAAVQDVPLDQIAGSVGRYNDFTRAFLPRKDYLQRRWEHIERVMAAGRAVPPVELYRVGEVYFVRDGNHRVSVARANGLTHIEAYVTVVNTDVPLTLEDFDRDEWIIKADHQEFMRKTGLNQLRPRHGINLTEPGRYDMMLRHIHVHWYLVNKELERKGADKFLEWPDAVASWYDNVYAPVVEAIRKYNLLEEFPHRTEADLYMWIAHHREELSREYELAPLNPDEAVSTFAEVYSESFVQRTMKGLRLGLHRVFGHDDKPLGMSEETYQELRNRHAAGEISLAEAEAEREQRAEEDGFDGVEGKSPKAQHEPHFA